MAYGVSKTPDILKKDEELKIMRAYNGVNVPNIGFGTWLVENDEASDIVKNAIECGYNMIDTAHHYKNENGVGQGIVESGVLRENIFVTSKLWNEDQGYETTLKAFEKSLDNLKVDYLDMYLVHWPIPVSKKTYWEKNMIETWKAMEKIYESGRVKIIGVSNFLKHHLEFLEKNCNIMPMVNQIEYHVGYMQEETVEYCKKNNILVEAWSPLARGGIFDVKELVKIAEKYNISTATLCLAWEIQKGIIPIPKTKSVERMKSNLTALNVKLDKEDIQIIDSIKECSNSGHNPDNINF